MSRWQPNRFDSGADPDHDPGTGIFNGISTIAGNVNVGANGDNYAGLSAWTEVRGVRVLLLVDGCPQRIEFEGPHSRCSDVGGGKAKSLRMEIPGVVQGQSVWRGPQAEKGLTTGVWERPPAEQLLLSDKQF